MESSVLEDQAFGRSLVKGPRPVVTSIEAFTDNDTRHREYLQALARVPMDSMEHGFRVIAGFKHRLHQLAKR